MTVAAGSATPQSRRGRLAAFVELGKLRLSSMAIFAVLAGLLLGAAFPPGWLLTLATIAGTILVAVGGNALNMFLERDTDPVMRRTEGRPLPSGRLSPEAVRLFGLITVAAGLGCLAVFTNWIATATCGVIGLTYVLVYTPLKRVSTLNTLVGAVPGALPPVVGYAAGTGRVDATAVVLFGIVFLWQIPHFLAIAWRYRDDYMRAGMQMLPVLDRDGRMTARQMVVYCACLVLVSTLPSVPFIALCGGLYLLAALVLGLLFFVATAIAARRRDAESMRVCFLTSITYLPLLFTAMVIDHLMTTATR